MKDKFRERLEAHPTLKARFESILDLAENSNGDVIRADDAEQTAINEVRKLGHEILPDWAGMRVKVSVNELKAKEKVLKGPGKKNSLAYHFWKSRS